MFDNRGQFLSVWCHVICQPVGHGVKILAMVCPLYMIRSHLPIPAKVLIDTPGLKVHLEVSILYLKLLVMMRKSPHQFGFKRLFRGLILDTSALKICLSG